MEDIDKENKYLRAKERVEALKRFYSELLWYVMVVGSLGWLNYYTNGWGYMWFLWVAAAWGIGLFFKALTAFRINPFLGKNWEERKLRQFMEEEQDANLPSKNRWE